MTDYTQAAQNKATVLLADGSTCAIHYVPAGRDGWIDPVIRAYDYNDVTMYWNTDGTALCADDADILEVWE